MTDPTPTAFRLLAANLFKLAGDFSSEKKDAAATVTNRIADVVNATADELERTER